MILNSKHSFCTYARQAVDAHNKYASQHSCHFVQTKSKFIKHLMVDAVRCRIVQEKASFASSAPFLFVWSRDALPCQSLRAKAGTQEVLLPHRVAT
jgi:hypothetical protein